MPEYMQEFVCTCTCAVARVFKCMLSSVPICRTVYILANVYLSSREAGKASKENQNTEDCSHTEVTSFWGRRMIKVDTYGVYDFTLIFLFFKPRGA